MAEAGVHRTKDKASSGAEHLNGMLDHAVGFFHSNLPRKYHPYFLFEDLAALSFIMIGFAFEAQFGHLSGRVHAIAIATTFVLYTTVYLRVKRRLLGVGARSFLQDSLLFVLPVYLGLSAALGQSILPALDVLALSLLLAVGFMRIGCFVGGCCHGKPCRIGVLYQRHQLRAVNGRRIFVPGEFFGVRVFPLQLVCSVCVFAIFVLLWIRLGGLPRPDGSTLLYAVIAYSGLRIVLEVFRGHRHRPKYFGVSEAQWLSVAMIIVAMAALVHR